MSHTDTPRSILVSLGLLVALAAMSAAVSVARAAETPKAAGGGASPKSAGAASASQDAKTLPSGWKKDQDNENAIRKLYGEFEKAWNKHDVATMAARWAIDGDHVEPDGKMAKGRDEVTALLNGQHSGAFKNSTLKLTVRTVWNVSDTVALVDGTYELSGAVFPDGSPVPERKGMLTSVLLLDRGKWEIAASRLMIPTVLPYKPKAPASPADAAAPKQP